MAEIALPDLSLLWASAGDILQPSDSKIQQGWAPEIPPRQWFNWLDNRQDQALAHFAQHGVAVWSPTIEYQAGKSYVQGSDGVIYKAITTNTNINPVGGAPGNWETPFLTTADVYTKSQVDAKTTIASTAQAQALSDNTTLISPLRLNESFKGSNQSLAANGYQKLPGGLIIQWGTAISNGSGVASVTLPITYPSGQFRLITNIQSVSFSTFSVNRVSSTGSSFVVNTTTNNIASPNAGFDWISIGF
jgi:hypothetical protein